MARDNVVTVTTTPTLLNALVDSSRGTSSLIATSSSAFVVGGPSVAAATGFPVSAGSVFSMNLADNETVYAVVASGSATVNVLQGAV